MHSLVWLTLIHTLFWMLIDNSRYHYFLFYPWMNHRLVMLEAEYRISRAMRVVEFSGARPHLSQDIRRYHQKTVVIPGAQA
jgi:hypothetical protein